MSDHFEYVQRHQLAGKTTTWRKNKMPVDLLPSIQHSNQASLQGCPLLFAHEYMSTRVNH